MFLAFTSLGCASYRQRVRDDLLDAFHGGVGFVGGVAFVHLKATAFLDGAVGAPLNGYRGFGFSDRFNWQQGEMLELTSCRFPGPTETGSGLGVGFTEADPPPMWLLPYKQAQFCNGKDACFGRLFETRALSRFDAYGPEKRVKCYKEISADQMQPYGFEAEVGLPFVMIGAGFDPIEFCDLVCTACGWDMLHDNPPKPVTGQPTTQN